MTFNFVSRLWMHSEMPGAWYFVTLPTEAADEIKARTAGSRRGFGSVRVTATIGSTTWSTSIFPDTKSASYVLPVKAAVRGAADVDDGDVVDVSVAISGSRTS